MAIVAAVSEMSAARLSVWFGAVLFVATTLVHSQVTWTPIYVGAYSEYTSFVVNYFETADIVIELQHSKLQQLFEFHFFKLLC